MRNIGANLGAPLAVTAVDIGTLEMLPEGNEWAAYIMTGVGYAAWAMNVRMAGDFLTNLGVASLPLTARHVYERVKASQGTSRRATAGAQRMALRSRSAAPSVNKQVSRMYQTEFEEAGAHAF